MVSSSEHDLLAALREDPYDEQARLVYADALQARGDVRGELLLLQHREDVMPAGLDDPEMLERLLVLAAQHGFLRVPDDDQDALDILPFATELVHEPQFVHPVAATLSTSWAGHRYELRVDRHLTVRVDDGPATLHRLHLGQLTDETLHVVAAVMSEAIRRDVAPQFPETLAAWEAHPAWQLGCVPGWPVPPAFAAAHPGELLVVRARDKKRWFELWERLQRLR